MYSSERRKHVIKLLNKLLAESADSTLVAQLTLRSVGTVSGAVKKCVEYDGIYEILAVAAVGGKASAEMVMTKTYFAGEDVCAITVAHGDSPRSEILTQKSGLFIPGRS
jgi:hypothetical protein